MSQSPLVSVVMPAFNSEKWIGEAVDSILSQTLRDLELIVVDDASTDSTAEVVLGVQDSRIKLIRSERNAGSATARNRAIEAARGEFVALMDSDDVALPHWLERQVDFLKRNPDCGLRGAWVSAFGARDGIWSPYEHHNHIKADLLFRCGMNQNTVVFRREPMNKLNLKYNAEFDIVQDYELWTRCIDHLKFSNSQEVLVKYRIHENNVSVRKKDKSLTIAQRIRQRQINKIGISPTKQEMEIHRVLGEYGPSGPRNRGFDIASLENWLIKLKNSNSKSGYLSDSALGILLYEYWRRCCKSDSKLMGASVLKFFTSKITSVVPYKRKIVDASKIMLKKPLYSIPRSPVSLKPFRESAL
jgi:glycosyltransferase involved in cell wall biosynthesis